MARNELIIWGIGLTELEAQAIRRAADGRARLVTWNSETLPDSEALDCDEPFLVLATWGAWGRASRAVPVLEGVTRAVILSETATAEDVQSATASGADAVLRLPIEQERVRAVVERAISVRRLYEDIFRMTQEIVLERELLSRKNEQLKFINRFLARAAESMDTVELLGIAQDELSKLLDITALHACIWGPSSEEVFEAELYLAENLSASAQQGWSSLLLDSAASLNGICLKDYRIVSLPTTGRTINPPSKGKTIILPLKAAGEIFGCIGIAGPKNYSLGRDQVELMNSAVSHLGLALRNAVLFSEARNEADYDGLTMIHNRRSFERRLKEELMRHQRYGHTMSLLLLDIDHFKAINDTYGHLAGDAVLAAVARTIRSAVRTCDYPARYGGEEFVIILPQTSAMQANILGERLRREIANLGFTEEGASFHVTASIGIADINPESHITSPQLVRRADRALYAAKNRGRNRVMVAAADEQCPSAAAMH
ncbi:GGDEF domain-containing protein [Oceanidesulfovibrio indonesiensis]|uniref:diguanylate cyclase n=1 Tax=Oceanidesulfovibrio indonesiensis TaxID=54767 RepID=A0A7M3MCH6_9BACT|nr:sensor domain-containing diguanylate cyclase [Oceanidesulfovibrio indonesiensis]TVM15677.1 GGDEF domain-containing protein [Oceanidesulfovibrio indonesiensis]